MLLVKMLDQKFVESLGLTLENLSQGHVVDVAGLSAQDAQDLSVAYRGRFIALGPVKDEKYSTKDNTLYAVAFMRGK